MDKTKNIKDYDALIRRANKIVSEFDRYPLMPEGNCSINFIENVFNFNPLFVLDDLRKSLINTLLDVTEYRYSEEDLRPIIEETYVKYEKKHKARILKILIDNYKHDLQYFRFKHWSYMMLRPEETVIFYYAYSIFYIARELNDGSALLFARKVLQAIDLFHCERGTNPIDGLKHSGKLLSLSEFQKDRAVYHRLMNMIDSEIENSTDENIKNELHKQKNSENHADGGCYVATCVYGSYDCPEVWTLRRFRDNALAKHYWGRLFIGAYYAVGPTLVKWFGNSNWFVHICRLALDKIVVKLQLKGFEDSPYEDKL